MKTIFNKMSKLVCLALAMALAVSLVGCGVDITSVGLPTDIVMEKGETRQLEIEYGTKDAAEQEKIAEAASKLNLTWNSSDEEVATVDETGLVTAVGAGETDVTVSVADANISSTTHVKVVIPPTGVEAPDALELVTNGENSKALNAKMLPEDATEVKLAYKSSDENVATVDENGVVTAVADGECIITTYVTADIPATAETADDDSKAVVIDGDAASSEAASNSESEPTDDAVATMPDNLDEIDAGFGVVPDGLSAETKVAVTTKVESILLDKSEGILYVGNSTTINATVAPDNASNANVTWSSSNEAVATVDSNGKATAVSAGSATITASSESNGDVSADYELTVQQKAAAKKNTTTATGSAGSISAAAPSYSAPAATVPSTPSTPQVSEPAPAPAPDPAPAEPAQPSGDSGNSGGGSNVIYGDVVDPNATQGSGIDWTQDNSCASANGGGVGDVFD